MPKGPSPSNGAITGLAILVIALFAAGMITFQAISLIEAPSSYDPATYRAYLQTVHRISFAGAVLLDIGVGVLLLMSVMVAVRRDDVAEAVRRGLLILATVVTALWLFTALISTGLVVP